MDLGRDLCKGNTKALHFYRLQEIIVIDDDEHEDEVGMRCKDWVFTIPNPSATIIGHLQSESMRKHIQFIIFQGEKGAGGLKHLQGFVQFRSRKRMQWLKKNFCSTGHYEQRRGTVEQAMQYPDKEESYDHTVCPKYRWGEPQMEKKKGRKPTATSIVAQAIIDGDISNAREAMLADPALYLRSRGNILGMINDVKANQTRDSHRLLIIFGDAGSGKSYKAKGFLDETYPGQWQQCANDLSDYVQLGSPKAVLIEEFSGNIELNVFKQIFDPAATAPKLKQRYFNGVYSAELTVITSNKHPGHWYQFKTKEDVKAVYRRIEECMEMRGEYVCGDEGEIQIIPHQCKEKGIPAWFLEIAWSDSAPGFRTM